VIFAWGWFDMDGEKWLSQGLKDLWGFLGCLRRVKHLAK
jgi:hypothetical protein